MTIKELKNKFKELKNKFNDDDVEILIESPKGLTDDYRFKIESVPVNKDHEHKLLAIFYVTERYGCYPADFFVKKNNEFCNSVNEKIKQNIRFQKANYDDMMRRIEKAVTTVFLLWTSMIIINILYVLYMILSIYKK